MASGDNWTDAELEVAAQNYLWMLQQQLQGKPFTKADVNRQVQEATGRGKGSVEYRMQNISAVMHQIGQPCVNGYLPADNVGEGVKARIRTALEKKGFMPASDYAPTSDEGELQVRVANLRKRRFVSPPTGQTAPEAISKSISTFVRDPAVKAWVIQNAAGKCEACNEPAPFIGADGEPYLEVHHMRSLANHGSDKTTNAVALCTNCHRHTHHGGDRSGFSDAIYSSVVRLVREI
jgi:5-methylcytosine-specific restriction protein A